MRLGRGAPAKVTFFPTGLLALVLFVGVSLALDVLYGTAALVALIVFDILRMEALARSNRSPEH